MKKEWRLALAAALLAVLSGGVSQAADHVMDTVYVDADKDKNENGTLPGGYVNTKATVGILGKKDVMETPFSETAFTAKAMETFGGPDKPLDSVLVNSPSVRQTGSILHGDFYFRGFRTNGTNYYVNGVPGVLTQFNTPMHIFESVELFSGPNVGLFGTGVQYETTAPGGTVSAVTKKAPDEGVFTYTQTVSGRGLFGEYIDWGKRFGENKEWGVRIMTENLNGKTSVKGTEMNGQSIFANIDHRSEHTKDNLFVGYRNLDIQGGIRWFEFDGKDHLPNVPSGDTDYSYPGMIKATNGWFMTYNHEQKFNEHWDGFFNFGMQDNDLDKNVMPYGSRYYVDENGNISGNYGTGGTPQKYYYWQVGTTAHYNTGVVDHDITVSYNQAWRNRKSGSPGKQSALAGDLDTGITTITPDPSYVRNWSNKTRIKSLGIVDSMRYNKWDFILGIHKHEARAQSFSNNKVSKSVDSDATSPTYGIVYRPNENWSIYGSHSEYFDIGTSVGSGYANENDVLPPVKSKQNEVGVKYKKDDLLLTLAYYDIKKDDTIDLTVGNDKYRVNDGRTRNKGIEFSANGKLADKWSIIAGVAKMNAKYERASKPQYNGAKVGGVSEWIGVLGLQYDPSEDWSIIGRAVYTGEAPLAKSGLTVPGYVVYDLGVSHKTKWNDVPVTLSLMCYNLFDKDYWMASRGSYTNDWIYLSTPRTLTFTAQFSF